MNLSDLHWKSLNFLLKFNFFCLEDVQLLGYHLYFRIFIFKKIWEEVDALFFIDLWSRSLKCTWILNKITTNYFLSFCINSSFSPCFLAISCSNFSIRPSYSTDWWTSSFCFISAIKSSNSSSLFFIDSNSCYSLWPLPSIIDWL